jgi:hypothetical protein
MEHTVKHLFIKENTLVDEKGVVIDRYDDDVQQIKRDISVIGRGIHLSLSKIPNAGYGVVAERDFEKDEVITFYDGSVAAFIPPKELTPKYRSHARKLTGEYTLYGNYLPAIGLIDSANAFHRDNYLPGTGGGAWMNDNQSKKENNATWFSFETKSRRLNPFGDTNPFHVVILIVATKPIQRNEEIFINYGQDYWSRVGTLSGGTKKPVFITQSQYEAEQAEKKKKPLKRMAPVLVIPGDQGEKRSKLTAPCFRCQKMTPLVNIETEVFICSKECMNVLFPEQENILCLL